MSILIDLLSTIAALLLTWFVALTGYQGIAWLGDISETTAVEETDGSEAVVDEANIRLVISGDELYAEVHAGADTGEGGYSYGLYLQNLTGNPIKLRVEPDTFTVNGVEMQPEELEVELAPNELRETERLKFKYSEQIPDAWAFENAPVKGRIEVTDKDGNFLDSYAFQMG